MAHRCTPPCLTVHCVTEWRGAVLAVCVVGVHLFARRYTVCHQKIACDALLYIYQSLIGLIICYLVSLLASLFLSLKIINVKLVNL